MAATIDWDATPSAGSAALVTQHAAAKINLALHVTGRRSDGYHLLETLVVFTEAGDTLTIEPAASDKLVLSGPFSEKLSQNEDNLVSRARDHLRSALAADSRSAPPVAIQLDKHLPIASGIGGGSADAAAALRSLQALWHAEDIDLRPLARDLGADVPMCLSRQPQMASGIGEHTRTIEGFPALDLVLVNPGVHVATPAVFAALIRKDNPPLPSVSGLSTSSSVIDYLRETRNDLQPAAIGLVPEIEQALKALETSDALFSRMSGSGATCFGLYADPHQAARAAAQIVEHAPHWYVTATRSFATENSQ
ncbi:4-diphosphocytidyl-2-C-methyl-D-erythritol kinase [Rhizobium albus]|nr:4-diphosphocytidyl-2-C-methyl-D-erythritol kinase [Rhizobium albus]